MTWGRVKRPRLPLFDALLLVVFGLALLGLLSRSESPSWFGKSLLLWLLITVLMTTGGALIALRVYCPRTVLNRVTMRTLLVGGATIVCFEIVNLAFARYLPIGLLLQTPSWLQARLPRSAFARQDFRVLGAEEFVDDPILGFRYPPRLDVRIRQGEIEFRLITDSQGFPNRDESLYRRADVVVTGDSLAMGATVEFDEAWPQQLARRTGLRVLNVSQGAWDVYQYSRVLEGYAPAASPRTIVVGLTTLNDLQTRYYQYEDYREIIPTVSGFREYYRRRGATTQWYRLSPSSPNYFSFALTNGIELMKFVTPFSYAWISLTREQVITSVCEFALRGRRMRIRLDTGEWAASPRGADRAFDLNQPAYSRYFERVMRDLRAIVSLARRLDARLYFVYLPGPEEIYVPLLAAATELNACARRHRDAYSDGAYDLRKAFREYERALGGERGYLLDATPYLRDRAKEGEQLVWTYDFHPNASGHRRIGEYVARHVGN